MLKVSSLSAACASVAMAIVCIFAGNFAKAVPLDKTASDLVNSIDSAFEASSCTNVESLMALYSDDVIVYEVTGHDGGKSTYREFIKELLCLMDDPKTPVTDHRINFTIKKVGGNENILWASGTYNPSYVNPKGEDISAPDLRFTFVWEKDSDGVYKVVSAHTSGAGRMR